MLGVVEYDAEQGKSVNVRLITGGFLHKVTSAEAISAGDEIYLAADGKVQTDSAGTVRIGKAASAATDDGQKITAWLRKV